MAKGPKRPAIRIGRIVGGALVDLGRRSPIVLPMVAVAFPGPLLAAFAVNASDPGVLGVFAALTMIFLPMVLLGSLMQSLLIALGVADLRPAGARWRLDLGASLRAAGFDLILNLMALATVLLAATMGGVALGVGATIVLPKHPDDTPWWVLAGAVLGVVPAVALLSRWATGLVDVHVDGQGVVGALLRSADLSAGHRLRISVLQAMLLASWPAVSLGILYPMTQMHLPAAQGRTTVAVVLGILGLLAALDALIKMRLYRELATVEGLVGSANLAEVFG